MFGIGWGEIVVVGIVMLVVLKPAQWPGFFHFLAQLYRGANRTINHVRTTVGDLSRELEIDTLTQQSYDAAMAQEPYETPHDR